MQPSENIIVAKNYIATNVRPSLYTNYNYQVNFLIVIVLIEVISVIVTACV